MIKKLFIAMAVILMMTASVCLNAQTDLLEVKAGKNYADKGIIELSGSVSLGGTTGEHPYSFFGAAPGFNYFVINNFYIGSHLFANVERTQMITYYPFLMYSRAKPVTYWNLGFEVDLGYAFKLSKNIFFNITPELNFIWYSTQTKYFRAYPNLLLSLKFILNNTSIFMGFRQNLFYFTDETNTGVSAAYYSYNITIGFSFFLDTGVK
jgi:hypothetical protein